MYLLVSTNHSLSLSLSSPSLPLSPNPFSPSLLTFFHSFIFSHSLTLSLTPSLNHRCPRWAYSSPPDQIPWSHGEPTCAESWILLSSSVQGVSWSLQVSLSRNMASLARSREGRRGGPLQTPWLHQRPIQNWKVSDLMRTAIWQESTFLPPWTFCTLSPTKLHVSVSYWVHS